MDNDKENVIFSMGKNCENSDEKQVFTIKDLDDVSYRQLNDWDKRGLLNACKRDNSNSWRKFSIFDIICLKIIRDMKKNLYSDEIIIFILDQIKNIKSALITGLFHNDEKDLYYLVLSQNGGYGIGKGHNMLVNFHREISDDLNLNNLLSESLLIIPIGQYYKEYAIKYIKKELEISKESSDNPLCQLPSNIRKMIILDVIENEDYKEILIQKKKSDYIIKPKSKDNKLTKKEIVKLIYNAEFQNIELKFTNGKCVYLEKEETIKI